MLVTVRSVPRFAGMTRSAQPLPSLPRVLPASLRTTREILGFLLAGFSCMAVESGGAICWGTTGHLTDIPSTARESVKAITAGGGHAAALRSDGTVIGWGFNATGQVTGSPTTTAPYSAVASPVALGGRVLTDVVSVAAGPWHSLALKSNGTVVAWGGNEWGAITGTPDQSGGTTIADPVALNGTPLSGIVAISAGTYHNLALNQNGSVVAWGQAQNGLTAVPEAARSGVTAVAAGGTFSAALKTDGSVIVWGASSPALMTVPDSARRDVTAIAAGFEHIAALKSDGTVIGWGSRTTGQSEVPAGLGGVVAIAAGSSHTVALKADGTVASWGWNSGGQVTGIPDFSNEFNAYGSANPVVLGNQPVREAIAIAGSQDNTFAVVAAGAPPPVLGIVPGKTHTTLLWTTAVPGYALQAADGLTPNRWTGLPGTPIPSAGWNTLTMPSDLPVQFFRLSHP